jgi:site-specific recombinase XerD
MKTSVLELSNLIQGFQLSCQTEGKSPVTVEWYTSFLERFRRFLEQNGLPTYVNQLDKNFVRKFILHLQQEAKVPNTGKPLSAATVQGYVRTLKSFSSWLLREEYVPINLMAKIPVPKGETKVINTFSNEQVGKIANVCYRSNGNGHRNLLISMLMLDTGVRVSELVNIDIDDINLNEGLIKIRAGKGNKERVLPIGSVVRKLVWKYLNCYRPQPLTIKICNLFLSSDGLKLTRNDVQQMIRRCGRQAGISGVRCSPHTFRHTFAKNYLINGGDIFSLQKILGHSSLASVRAYLNFFGVDIKKQHQKYSPVDNLVDEPAIYPLIRVSSLTKS